MLRSAVVLISVKGGDRLNIQRYTSDTKENTDRGINASSVDKIDTLLLYVELTTILGLESAPSFSSEIAADLWCFLVSIISSSQQDDLRKTTKTLIRLSG
jgi:hypothetical protein